VGNKRLADAAGRVWASTTMFSTIAHGRLPCVRLAMITRSAGSAGRMQRLLMTPIVQPARRTDQGRCSAARNDGTSAQNREERLRSVRRRCQRGQVWRCRRLCRLGRW
jgi:hypothetical protein